MPVNLQMVNSLTDEDYYNLIYAEASDAILTIIYQEVSYQEGPAVEYRLSVKSSGQSFQGADLSIIYALFIKNLAKAEVLLR